LRPGRITVAVATFCVDGVRMSLHVCPGLGAAGVDGAAVVVAVVAPAAVVVGAALVGGAAVVGVCSARCVAAIGVVVMVRAGAPLPFTVVVDLGAVVVAPLAVVDVVGLVVVVAPLTVVVVSGTIAVPHG
jgi:hypothetical protein